MKFEINFGVKNLDKANSDKKVYTIYDLYKEQLAEDAKALASKDFGIMLIQYRQTMQLRFQHAKELSRQQLDNLAVECFRLETALTVLHEQAVDEANDLRMRKITEMNNR